MKEEKFLHEVTKCHCCDKELSNKNKFASHNGLNICENCIKKCIKFLDKVYSPYIYRSKKPAHKRRNKNKFYCSFCGRHSMETDELFLGKNDFYICNSCVKVCQNMLKNKSTFEEEYNALLAISFPARGTIEFLYKNVYEEDTHIDEFMVDYETKQETLKARKRERELKRQLKKQLQLNAKVDYSQES